MNTNEIFEDKKLLALAKAAADGNTQKIEILIKNGVNVNGKGKLGVTPLLIALQNKKGFESLLEHGADPNLIFQNGSSVMHWAARLKDCDFLRSAIKYGGNVELKAGMLYQTPIFETIMINPNDGIPECLRVLVDAGANINAVAGTTNTPILEAAELGRYEIVLFLMKNGADIHKKNASGKDLLKIVLSHVGAFRTGSKSEKLHQKVLKLLTEK